MEYNEAYIKEKVASNYKIATFVFTTFLATMAGVVALYQKGDLGVLFVIICVICLSCTVDLFTMV
ncbi:MAG: hypothetical protein WD555_05075 [Fulvivirga sp.]